MNSGLRTFIRKNPSKVFAWQFTQEFFDKIIKENIVDLFHESDETIVTYDIGFDIPVSWSSIELKYDFNLNEIKPSTYYLAIETNNGIHNCLIVSPNDWIFYDPISREWHSIDDKTFNDSFEETNKEMKKDIIDKFAEEKPNDFYYVYQNKNSQIIA